MQVIHFFIACLFPMCYTYGKAQSVSPEKTKIDQAYQFVKKNKMDTTLCILLDMSIHSGKNRLYVYDFQKNTLVLQGLSAHGCGKAQWAGKKSSTEPIFSNVPDSHCSSLGKYKIGVRAYSSWGIHIHYKLHGLEASNNNAFKRTIVLHSWEWMSDREIYPQGSPESWGCPAVSDRTMEQLDVLLKNRKLPVLLWIYKD